MLRHYIKIAIRHLLKYKMQNLISIMGLSVGILCFSICLYCSRFIDETDQCFTNRERIADINLYLSGGDVYSGVPATLIEELRKRNVAEVEDYTFTVYPRERSYSVEIEEGRELPYDDLNTMEVDSSFHKVFTPRILQGSWEVAAHTPNAVILTRSLAEKIFGKLENPIGKRMILMQRLSTAPDTTPRTGGIAYTIQAVIEDIPLNTSLSFLKKLDMLTLNDSEGTLQFRGRGNMTGGFGFALLHEGKTAGQLEAHFRSANMKHRMYDEETAISALPFGQTFWNKSIAPYFAGITLIIGLLILLTGLLNFFHFLIGTFLNRYREYGIRKVIGSGTGQLFYQLFTQTLVIALLAFLLTFCMIEIFSPYLNFTLFNFVLVIEKNLLLIHAAEYMGMILLLCMALCFITVLRIRHLSVQTGIFGSKVKRNKHGMRNTLLGIQFFICWIFIAFTVALYMQAEKTTSTLFHTLTEKEKANIVSFPIDYRFMKNEEKLALIDRISQYPGVQDKLLADISYLQGISGTGMQTEKENSETTLDVSIMSVSNNFFQFMNIPMLSGRTLETKEDLVVDKALMERMKKDLLGITLYNYSDGYTVCGVCADFIADVYNKSEGFVFMPTDFSYYVGHCYLKCEPGRTAEVKQFAEKVLKEALPSSVQPKVSTLLEDIFNEQAIENKLKGVILFFSLVSLIITLLGVYSAITLDTERRQKEVAIRKVNGAGLKQIIFLFARLYIGLLLGSAVVAFPLIYAVLQLWKRTYTVFFNDGILYWAGIFLGVTVITAFTVLFRILKIARVNPAEVIKNE
jgi:putative ABC transport system permease protein